MTDVDPLEARLRRTFQAVADRPVAPSSHSTGDIAAGGPPRTPRRNGRLLVGAVVGVVVIAGFAVAIALGPGSSGPGTGSSPTGSAAGGTLRAVFVAISTHRPGDLTEAAATMQSRLHAFGDRHASVTVRDGQLDVRGPKVSATDLTMATEQGNLLFRPVECAAAGSSVASSSTPTTVVGAAVLPSCGPQYVINSATLGIPADPGSFSISRGIPPDPGFAGYPSTVDDPGARVLLDASDFAGAEDYARYVLGPAGLELHPVGVDGSGISAVNVQHATGSPATIDITLTPEASARWDAFAQQNFHQEIAVDLDGEVISAPVMQPANSAFVSFRGQLQISGNYTESEAEAFAAVLGDGPMPVDLAPKPKAEAGVVTVPNVVGDSLADASQVLTRLGLPEKVNPILGVHSTLPDQVVAQDPAPGSKVAVGSVITLTEGPAGSS